MENPWKISVYLEIMLSNNPWVKAKIKIGQYFELKNYKQYIQILGMELRVHKPKFIAWNT